MKSKVCDTANNLATSEPSVGIFWLLDGKLIIDATPLSKAELYGSALGHPTSHIDHWKRLQRTRTVPAEIEYEEPPRGRVVYDQREERFHLLADRCILSWRNAVAGIIEAMHLPPSKTTEGRDEQYRCSTCLYPAAADDDNGW